MAKFSVCSTATMSDENYPLVCSTVLSSLNDQPKVPKDSIQLTHEKLWVAVKSEHWWPGSLHFNITAGIFLLIQKRKIHHCLKPEITWSWQH
jgi:hypothetical protein